jgi:hypothetical protein
MRCLKHSGIDVGWRPFPQALRESQKQYEELRERHEHHIMQEQQNNSRDDTQNAKKARIDDDQPIARAGKKHAVMCEVWLEDEGTIWEVEVDPEFDITTPHSTPAAQEQGRLFDIRQSLPMSCREQLQSERVQKLVST